MVFFTERSSPKHDFLVDCVGMKRRCFPYRNLQSLYRNLQYDVNDTCGSLFSYNLRHR